MDSKDIDAMFDDAARRLTAGVNPTAGYGEPPLAADHFLLRRSWEFFQKRLKAMEDHWSQIASAKDAEITALEKASTEARNELARLKLQVTETDEIDRTLISGRLEDQQEFAAKLRRLQETWEEEREALERRVTDAESLKDRIRKEADSRLAAMTAEIGELRQALSGVRTDMASAAEKRVTGEASAAETLIKRDEVIRSLESKVEILKSELARREVLAREAAERMRALTTDLQKLQAEHRASTTALREGADRAADLDLRLKTARLELEDLRAARKSEQAEWRELWDRAREMWEKEKGRSENRDFPSENG